MKPADAEQLMERGLERFRQTEKARVGARGRYYSLISLLALKDHALSSEHGRKMLANAKARLLAEIVAAAENLDSEPIRQLARDIDRYRAVNKAVLEPAQAGTPLKQGFKPVDRKDLAIWNTYKAGLTKADHYKLVSSRVAMTESEFHFKLKGFPELGYVRGKPGPKRKH